MTSATMCSTPAEPASERGFTLIEVLLAVGILALVGTFIFASITTTTNAMETARIESGREQMVRSVFTLLTQDLTLSRNLTTSPVFGQNQIRDGLPSDSLAFVTANHRALLGGARQSDQARVVYAVVKNRLVRYVRPNLLSLTEEGVDRVELADNVVGFNVRYYDGRARLWLDRWDGRTQKDLPRGFMIELLLDQGPQQLPRIYTTWLTLPT